MSMDITKVIAHSMKCRDIALNGVICLEENVVDFEGKLDLADGKRVILTISQTSYRCRMLSSTNTTTSC